LTFNTVLVGTLKRHAQTLQGIRDGLGNTPDALQWPGLNEYDSEALIRALHPNASFDTKTPEGYREHFRMLRDGLKQWMAGTASPLGMPTYPEFLLGVTSALDHVRQHCEGNVLLVSSGGPISTAVAQVLQASPETSIELNLRMRNSSVSEFHFTPKRHNLVAFNSLPHLAGPEHREWITHA
jgi:broad specificity phosphatase PhoE